MKTLRGVTNAKLYLAAGLFLGLFNMASAAYCIHIGGCGADAAVFGFVVTMFTVGGMALAWAASLFGS